MSVTNPKEKNTSRLKELGTLRPRRPITIEIGALPDDALVDKHVRRAVTGLGDSETYGRIVEGRFPAPLKLGKRCSRWRVGELRAWLADPLNWHAEVAE